MMEITCIGATVAIENKIVLCSATVGLLPNNIVIQFHMHKHTF
jgi:hypothetical protein